MNRFAFLSSRRLAIRVFMPLVVFAVACGHHDGPLGPPIPSGATILGGPPPMTSAPPPPPGWELHPVVPTSQQQAQDTLLGNLRQTLQGLPTGTALDATGFGGATNTPPCEDVIHGTPRKALTTTGELKLPAGSDPVAIIAKTGDIWKSWGWYVMERDGFRHPNQFGYAPDGYSLQIVVAARNGFGPTVQGTSPCFPGDLPDDREPFPMVLKAD